MTHVTRTQPCHIAWNRYLHVCLENNKCLLCCAQKISPTQKTQNMSTKHITLLRRGGQIQIKSNRRKSDLISNQLKSNHRIFENRQIKSNHEAQNRAQIKSNHDLIPISNQVFGSNPNQAIKRSNIWFHRQIGHRSKALSELFPSVRLVSPESLIWNKNASIMISGI